MQRQIQYSFRLSLVLCLLAYVAAMHVATRRAAAEGDFPDSRDPLQWPFTQNSIWNMPIGNEAVYVPAGILEFIPYRRARRLVSYSDVRGDQQRR